MNRFGILDQLRDNWPRTIENARIVLLERKTREFTLDQISSAVDTVLEECQYAPTVRDMVEACKKAQRASMAKDRARANRKPVPGDVVDGFKTLTPAEAKSELERMRAEHPEAFRGNSVAPCNPYDKEATAKRFELVGHRIYVKALQKCVSLDPGIQLEPRRAKQEDLFNG